MSRQQGTPGSLGPDDVTVLARMAGITIEDESLPLVAEMLGAVTSAADNLLVVSDADVAGIVEQFDPAWLVEKRGAK